MLNNGEAFSIRRSSWEGVRNRPWGDMPDTQSIGPFGPVQADESVSPNVQTGSDVVAADGATVQPDLMTPSALPTDFYLLPRPELSKKFHPQKPSDFRLFVQGTYFITQGSAGLPDGLELLPLGNDGYGNYTMGFTGPTTGWSYGEGSVGMTFQHWENIQDLDRPDKVIYRGGFPLTLRFDFGMTNNTVYSPTMTASTQQLQGVGSQSVSEMEQALIDAYYNGDYSGIFNVGDAINAIIRGYDPSADFTSETLEEDFDVPYYRLTLMPWIASKDKFNTSRLVNFGEIARFGVGPSLYWMGGDEFLGARGEIEISAVRASYGPVRADLMINGAAGFYYGYDPAYLGETGFWEDGQFMLDGSVGASLMITTNLPQLRQVGKAAKVAGQAFATGAENYYAAAPRSDWGADMLTSGAGGSSPEPSVPETEAAKSSHDNGEKLSEREIRRQKREERKRRLAERLQKFDIPMDMDDVGF